MTEKVDDWTTQGTHEVVPGVFRLPLPLPNDGLRAVNVYILVAPDGLVLIDSGWAIAEARTRLDEGLRAIDCTLADVGRFLVTHVHRDHYTQAVHVRREFGSRVALGVDERPTLEKLMDPGHAPLGNQLAALRRCGADALADDIAKLYPVHTDPVMAGWEFPDDWLHDADRVAHGNRTLEVVATPGHTEGHVVFHDMDAKLLFAGDHVLPTITPSIGVGPLVAHSPLADFLRSLAIVRKRPDALLLPAHGPVSPSVHARIDELTAHHGARLDEVEATVRQGANNAFEVASAVRWTRRGRSLSELDLFNQMLAVTETEAHLVVLAAQQRLRQVDEGSARQYF